MKSRAAVLVFLVCASALAVEPASPVLSVPGSPEKRITPQLLLGHDGREVKLENERGEATTYRGVPLLEVVEKNGLEAQGMGAERRLAPAIVVVSARDGYTVAFSVGELLMHRADPRVYLSAERAQGPLPAEQGPVRLVVIGQRSRSAYGLSRIEIRLLAEDRPPKRAREQEGRTNWADLNGTGAERVRAGGPVFAGADPERSVRDMPSGVNRDRR